MFYFEIVRASTTVSKKKKHQKPIFWLKKIRPPIAGEGGGNRALEISPFTEVAAAATATATLWLAGNELAFRTNSFLSLASFFRFSSYEMLGFFGYLFRFLYPLGVQNGSVLFESLVYGCEYLIRESLFCNFFWFSGLVFGSRVCFGFCFQRL